MVDSQDKIIDGLGILGGGECYRNVYGKDKPLKYILDCAMEFSITLSK